MKMVGVHFVFSVLFISYIYCELRCSCSFAMWAALPEVEYAVAIPIGMHGGRSPVNHSCFRTKWHCSCTATFVLTSRVIIIGSMVAFDCTFHLYFRSSFLGGTAQIHVVISESFVTSPVAIEDFSLHCTAQINDHILSLLFMLAHTALTAQFFVFLCGVNFVLYSTTSCFAQEATVD